MTKRTVIIIGLLISGLLLPLPAADGATTDKDREEIRAAAVDYIEGWFEGNAERMARCLHPDLSKRGLFRVPETGRNRFGIHSASTLVEGTRLGRGKNYPRDQRDISIIILDLTEEMASVKVTCLVSVEYLHLARYDGRWKIVNVLWVPTGK